MADLKAKFSASTAFTITLDGLADGSSRESTAVDNGTTLYPEARIRLTLQGDSASNTDLVYLYLYESLDDETTYTDNATGSDAAFTTANILNCRLIGVMKVNGTTALDAHFMVHNLPGAWGIIVRNESGDALETTGSPNSAEWEGIYYTST